METLLFCQQKYERITVREWDNICDEEVAAEEEQQAQHVATDEAEARPYNLSQAGS